MKTKIYLRSLPKLAVSAFCFLLACSKIYAQNIFPATGRAGIYTTAPAASLQVKGGARIGTLANYLNVDSATGNLSFVGTSAYRVAGNKYAFQYSGNTNYGLFFNSTNVQYEFRNGSAVPVFSVNANNGNSVFNGTVKVGAYTFPSTDGTNGQVLKTNGSGTLTWSNDNAGSGSGWLLTGNAGTDSSINFIGTKDAHPLVFRVNNQKSGWIEFTGNNNTSFGYQGLLANTTGFYNTAVGYNSLKANREGGRNTSVGAYALLVNTAENNTAIGTYALVSNTSGTNNVATGVNALTSNNEGSGNTALGVNAGQNIMSGSNNVFIGFNADASHNVNNSICIGSNTFTSNSNVLILGTNQNVGIGTPNPAYKLSVNGTIQSKEVRVETGWSDYVFEKDYKLPTLENIASYIEMNKHLPGIPSAKEIQDNGLAVGEVQTKMMAKIEELTLYIIQLKKEVDALKNNK